MVPVPTEVTLAAGRRAFKLKLGILGILELELDSEAQCACRSPDPQCGPGPRRPGARPPGALSDEPQQAPSQSDTQ